MLNNFLIKNTYIFNISKVSLPYGKCFEIYV